MQSRSRGFTLIELMVVVALAAVMGGMALPSFRTFIAGQRVKTAASEFAMATIFARSEAIKRNADVTITAVSSGAAGWKDGWAVTAVIGAAVTPLSNQQAYSGLTLVGSASPITYQSSGRPSAAVTTMTITGQDGSIRCVAIDLSGMPRNTKITTGTCP